MILKSSKLLLKTGVGGEKLWFFRKSSEKFSIKENDLVLKFLIAS
jgi:hypothetical protein